MSNIISTIKKLPKAFWASNIIELFERWAWYGFYMAFALYLTGSKETGALGFTAAQKGTIMGTGSMLLYLLPVLTGAIADRVGYRIMLILSFTMYIAGYWMIGTFSGFGAIYISFIVLAIAGAIFKPVISAMISKTTTSETSSIGFGFFYMMVNVGGFIGPFIAGAVYQKSWDYVFYISMATIAINYIFVFFMFKEPERTEDVDTNTLNIISRSLKNIAITLSNWRYVIFLVIMIAFWTAFNQLYYALPIFIDDWVNTSSVYNIIHSVWPWLAKSIGTAEGTITAVTITSMDSFFIILLQVLISGLVMKMKPLNAMMIGIIILSAGIAVMFSSTSGLIIILGILIFSTGEMASSPKFTEYIGSIAPNHQKALYMGTSFLPIAVAHYLAGWLSGDIYDHTAGKLFLLKKELAKRGVEISNNLSQSELWQKAEEMLGMNNESITAMLWNNHEPSSIWLLYTGIALSSVVALFIYDKLIIQKK